MISHRRFLYSAGFLAVLLLCWPSVIAQTSSAQAAKPATISGRVVNESGRPLPRASITLMRWASRQPEGARTTTDREGKFEVSGLQPVNYQIFAYLQGYVPVLRDLDATQPALYRAGDSVTVVLTKGGVITGAVTNQTGEPLVGVNVRALMVHAGDSFPDAYNRISHADLTDDRGIYRIYGLPEGTYVVWAGGGGEQNYGSAIDPFADDVPTYAPASTRDTAQEIIVRAGLEASGVNIQYRGGSGHAVSGIARGPAGIQLSGFGIFMSSTGPPQWQMRSSQGDNDRGFMLQGVDDGDYNVIAISQSPQGELMFSDPKQIKVRGADVTGVELIVQPLSSVTGRVALEETKSTECSDKQRPVFSETLVSAQSNRIQPIRWFLSPPANPDERGNVVLKNLPPGRYYFTTEYFARDWYLKSLSFIPPETANKKAGKPVDAARTWTTLKPGDRLNGLTITLAQGAASLRGHLALSEAKTRAEKMHVYLVPAEKEAADDPLRFYVASATAEGKVSLNNLAPGRYLVFAQEATESISPSMKLRSPDETAYRLNLRRTAETLKTEIELKPCQKLTDLKVPRNST